jgi:hypothetical protein
MGTNQSFDEIAPRQFDLNTAKRVIGVLDVVLGTLSGVRRQKEC